MMLQDSCMKIKSQWPLWEVTDWVVKSLWLPLHIIWINPPVISVSILLQWINITSNQQEKSEDTFKPLKILTSQEASLQSSLILNNKFNVLNGETWFKATLSREKLHTDGNSTLKLLLKIFYQAHPTLYGSGQLLTVFSPVNPCSFSPNTQDGFIWVQTLYQCLKSALNFTVSMKESVTFKVMKILKVKNFLI